MNTLMNTFLNDRGTVVAVLFIMTVALFTLGHSRIAEGGQAVTTTLNCDTDGSGDRGINDAIRFATWLFLAGPAPVELQLDGTPTELLNGDCNGDCNGDGGRDFVDCMALLFFLFGTGDAPVEPEPRTSVVIPEPPRNGRLGVDPRDNPTGGVLLHSGEFTLLRVDMAIAGEFRDNPERALESFGEGWVEGCRENVPGGNYVVETGELYGKVLTDRESEKTFVEGLAEGVESIPGGRWVLRNLRQPGKSLYGWIFK